jgi:serine protease Do
VRAGDDVLAISARHSEEERRVSTGTITRTSRTIVARDGNGHPQLLENMLQTSVSLYPGSSGGPLLSSDGSVLGVNTAVAVGFEDISFAIPAAEVVRVLEANNIVVPYAHDTR